MVDLIVVVEVFGSVGKFVDVVGREVVVVVAVLGYVWGIVVEVVVVRVFVDVVALGCIGCVIVEVVVVRVFLIVVVVCLCSGGVCP